MHYRFLIIGIYALFILDGICGQLSLIPLHDSHTDANNSHSTYLLAPPQPDIYPKEFSMYNMNRNTLYNEDFFMFTYERILPIKAKLGYTLKGGILIFDPFLWVADVGIITCGPKHFFEAAFGGMAEPTFNDFGMVIIRTNYRFQSNKALVFKIGPIISPPDNFILPLLSFGYSF